MNAIDVEDLHKIYRSNTGSETYALNGVSFEVPQGMIYGLLGPNGAGKSTLVRILSTITSPTSGRAVVLGCDVARQPLATRRQMVVVLQHTASENLLTVRDNLLIYAYLQKHNDSAAKKIADEASAVTVSYPEGSYTNMYALAAIPARYTLERGAWKEAAALTVRPAPDARETEAITHFARAIGAARSGDTAAARADVTELEAIEREFPEVKIQRLAASAWLALAAGDTATALAQASQASDLEDRLPTLPVSPGPVLPARELYGDLLVAAGRPREAHAAYLAMLVNAPHRARSVEGAARTAAAESH